MNRKTNKGEADMVSPYSVHPGVAMVQKWVATLKAKTGRSLEEWVVFVKAKGPPTEMERRAWLRGVHGLGTNSAWWIGERCDDRRTGHWDHNPESYLALAPVWVDKMFGGKKESLRPIYEQLLTLGKSLGSDVRVCPCVTIVPLYRNKVFAQIKPTTNKRVDLGFALGDTKPGGRLIDTGGFAKKDRITHRIGITHPNEIDDEVLGWLRTAYDRDAGGAG